MGVISTIEVFVVAMVILQDRSVFSESAFTASMGKLRCSAESFLTHELRIFRERDGFAGELEVLRCDPEVPSMLFHRILNRC